MKEVWRMGNFLFVIVLTVLFLATAHSQGVFVVSDVYAIRPDGSAQELKGGDFGNLKVSNHHWDAATQTISLYGARNEEVAVQVVMPMSGEGFYATSTSLIGPDTIPKNRIRFSVVAWVQHEEFGLLPDLVIPLDGSVNGIRSFDIPLDIKGIPHPENKVGVMLMEVWIPENVPAGSYQGKVEIYNREGMVTRLSVALTVFDFSLPAQPHFAFEFLSYGMPHRGFGLNSRINGDGLGKPARFVSREAKTIDYQVYQLALDHRCFVNALPYRSQRGNPTHAYPIAGRGRTAHITSFLEWDDYFGPILEGKLSKFGSAPLHFLLPFNINYPYLCESKPEKQFDFRPYKSIIPESPGVHPDLREFEETFKTIAGQYLEHFQQKGWDKTIFQIF
ncbi:MAG: hypothetical protein D6748_15130, partial [Calditrichaeota bacterium]